jgi:hypothetical protein
MAAAIRKLGGCNFKLDNLLKKIITGASRPMDIRCFAGMTFFVVCAVFV